MCADDVRGNNAYYVCDTCNNYYIHKECVDLPLKISNHPFHPSHPLFLCFVLHNLPQSEYTCDSCHRYYNYFTPWYRCAQCDFNMDKRCALIEPITTTISEEQIQHFIHQHPMQLIHTFHEYTHCFACGDIITTVPIYGCTTCFYYLHKSCAELPHEIHHPSHPKHSLICHAVHNNIRCRLCSKNIQLGISYKCHQCGFFMCVNCCVRNESYFIKYTSHEHLLTLVEQVRTYIRQCQSYDSYCKQPLIESSKEFQHTDSFLLRCSECEINVHLLCGPLRSVIKHECHIDPFILVDSQVEDNWDEYYCDICEKERDPRICFYYCKYCKYAAHIHFVIYEVIKVLKGNNDGDHVELKIASEDVWKFPEGIKSNISNSMMDEEGDVTTNMTLKDFINQLSEEDKDKLRGYYKWEVTSSKRKDQVVVESSDQKIDKVKDIDEDVNMISKLSCFSQEDFEDTLDGFDDFYRTTESELKSTDLDMKIVKVKGYMIPQPLVSVFKTLIYHHPNVCGESYGTTEMKSFCLFILCKVVKRMCNTMVKDITRDLLQQWYLHLKFVLRRGFKIDFARAHFESLVRAFIGLEAKRLEEEIPEKLKCKLAQFQEAIEKCKEFSGSSQKSELMKECLEKASQWKLKKACDFLLSDLQENSRPISTLWHF